jgi:hypothetical protein
MDGKKSVEVLKATANDAPVELEMVQLSKYDTSVVE